MASLLHKLQTGDPRAVGARGGTGDGHDQGRARALGMESRIGSLRRARRADVIVDVSGARQTPMYDPVSHLVYVLRGGDVRTTIVNGRVMKDRRVSTLREADVIRDARAWADKVRAAVR